MKKTSLFILMVWTFQLCFAQPGAGYQRSYRLLHSANIVADKNFYLFTAISSEPELQKALTGDAVLKLIFEQQTAQLKAHGSDSCQTITSLLTGFKWSNNDTIAIAKELRILYITHCPAFDAMINNNLRPSGYYERFKNYRNEDFLVAAWKQATIGLNYIIDQYGFGRKMRYPDVDSVSIDVKSPDYSDELKIIFSYLKERTKLNGLFYEPSLAVAMQLMALNNRDEPARFDPLEQGENKASVQKAATTAWNRYSYTAILVPGAGLENWMRGLSPIGRMHCDLAADRYEKRLAPFIIVSGGFVHPFQTPYCEAIEMKKYLITQHHIPVSAIIIDPQARHTTTNFRNAERLMIRYGFPLNRPALCVTNKDQTDGVAGSGFDRRNLKELGYLPYHDKKHLGDHEVSFFPVMESLHMDPYDPIDP